jgi:archaemetzincin
MAIALLPLTRMSEKTLEELKEEIGNAFISRVEVLPPLPSLPEGTYDKKREQYDAANLLSHLSSKLKPAKADKAVAIGGMDMFAEGLNFVFGAAEKSGRFAVVSLYRLDPRFYGKLPSPEQFKERLAKEAIHELGHCYGLSHCKDKKCVMQFSNDIISVDTKGKYFCGDCREKLRKALC